MNWVSVKITIAQEGLDELLARLVAEGFESFAVEDSNEFKEFLDQTVYYDYIDESVMKLKDDPCSVTVYLPGNQQGEEEKTVLERLVRGISGATLIEESLHDEDWSESWKKYFKPIPVGKKLVIKPSWETVEESEERTVLELDPSSSFGTGSHATTRLCLETLETIVKPEAEVLDIGCGSGILGVGALLLGAKSVLAMDIEEDAVSTSRENAFRNGFGGDRFSSLRKNILEDEAFASSLGQFDVIAANIVAGVIIAMAPHFTGWLKAKGRIVVSGIIAERQAEVIWALYHAGLDILCTRKAEDWVAITAGKRI